MLWHYSQLHILLTKCNNLFYLHKKSPSMILITVPNLLGWPQPVGDCVDLKIMGTKIFLHEFQSQILNLAVLN